MEPRPPVPSLEHLLAQSSWIAALARSLAADEDEARDLVQETWLRALKRPPELRPGAESARRWLATVLRNALAQRWRATTRRRAREEAAAATLELPAAERALEREQVRRVVVEAVLALDEPYREAVLLRYFDELSPAEIAARLGVPGSTVRSRLQRGLALLRSRLGRGRRSDGTTWLPALVLLIPRERHALLASTGGLAVKTKLVTAVAVLALAALTWRIASNSRPAPSDAALRESVEGPDRLGTDPIAAPEVVGSAGADAGARSQAPEPVQRVRAVDRATGLAIPGAEILYAERSALRAFVDWVPLRSGDDELDLREIGALRIADERGEAELPADGTRKLVGARAGELWGQVESEGTAAALEIELERDLELLVRVVDRAGSPVAGVPVALSPLGHGSGFTRSFPSGSDGIARLRHLQRTSPGRSILVAHFAFPYVGATERRVDLDALPAEGIELVMPPTGSVRVRLVDASGAPAAGVPYQLDLRAVHAAGTYTASSAAAIRTDRGEGRFLHVGLGLELWLTGFPELPGRWKGPMSRFQGPTREGEEIAVDLVLPPPRPRVRATVIGSGGAPLARQTVDVAASYEVDENHEDVESVETGEDGSFEIASSTLADRPPHRLRVVARLADGAVEEGVVELPELGAGLTELGSIALTRAPLLASGVVTSDGRRVAGARVDLLVADAAPFVPRSGIDAAGIGYASIEWEPRISAGTTTDREGRFAVHATLHEARRLALQANAEGFAPTPVFPIEGGRTDVVLELDRTVTIRGRIVADSIAALGWLRISARDPASTATSLGGARSRSAILRRDGTFEIPALPDVPVDVTVGIGREDLVELTGVRAGDPRLGLVDLRGRVHVLRIDVVGPGGAAVAEGVVALGEGQDRVEAPIREGYANLVSATDEAELEVRAPGMRTESVIAKASVTRVELRASPRLAASIPEGLVVTDGLDVAVELRPQGSPRDVRTRRFRGAREISLEVPDEGEWAVRWMLHDPQIDSWRVLATSKVQVGFEPEPPRIELSIAADELADAARAMLEIRARDPRAARK